MPHCQCLVKLGHAGFHSSTIREGCKDSLRSLQGLQHKSQFRAVRFVSDRTFVSAAAANQKFSDCYSSFLIYQFLNHAEPRILVYVYALTTAI